MNQKIVFLGDSLTERGNWQELFPKLNIVNNGVSGNKTYEILNRLNKTIEIKAEKLFFMAGINDLGDNRSINEIIIDYNTIIEEIMEKSPVTKIFLLSVLAINEKKINKHQLTNSNIIELNNKIKNISKTKDLRFINMLPAFSDNAGQLKTKYSSDGLHLSYEGYKLWKELIKNYL